MSRDSKEAQRAEVHKTIWRIANDLRGSVDGWDFKTYVLVASVRHPQHVVEAALAGGHICTMPFAIFQQMVKHPLTDIGLKKFLADWDAQNKKII